MGSKDIQTGHKALSFQEPYATFIATGMKTIECRSRKITTPVRGLVVCASKTASVFYPIPGLVYGYAIGMVDVVDCIPFSKEHLRQAMMSEMPAEGSYAWVLENVCMIEPFSVHATASFFYVDNDPVVITNNEEAYRAHVLPVARKGEKDDVDTVLEALFDDQEANWELYGL